MGSSTAQANCDLARERMSLALDNELSWFAALRLRTHLMVCSSCRGYRGELHSLTTILRNQSRPRRLYVSRPRLVGLPLLPLAVVAAALVVTVGIPHQHHPAYRGGAFPATQGMPTYDTSIGPISRPG